MTLSRLMLTASLSADGSLTSSDTSTSPGVIDSAADVHTCWKDATKSCKHT
jgi:hypothetical protein